MRPAAIVTTPLIAILVGVLAMIVVIFVLYQPKDARNQNSNTIQNTNLVACTRDAKICPDGSTVGRTGSKCEFTLCPGESEIDNFEECEAAGYPVMESYPRQCAANNQTFVESITNTNQSNPAQDGCVVTGCSGQVCSDQDVVTTCEYRAEYACYQSATCERRTDGQCGWTNTVELQSCLENAGTGEVLGSEFDDGVQSGTVGY